MDYAVETEQTAEKALAALEEPSKPSSSAEKVGRGLASGFMSYDRMTFLHDTSRSFVSVELDGSVTVKCGLQDIGGGQASSVASLAAEVLGVHMEEVKVFIGDTALTPIAGTTTATRMLYMSGNATVKAAEAVKNNLLPKAAEMLDADPKDLVFRDKKVFVKGAPTHVIPIDQVVKACAADGIKLYNVAQFNAPFRELMDFKTGQGQVFPDFTFGSHAAEVTVDTETGKVKVLKLVACYDVGQAINPLSAEGQLEGGALYRLGYGLIEEVILDKGITLTPSFSEYLIPTALDAPTFGPLWLSRGMAPGPLGPKGSASPPVIPSHRLSQMQ